MKINHLTIQTIKFQEEIDFFVEHIGLSLIKDLRAFGKNIVFLTSGPGDPMIEIIENSEANNSGNEHISIGFKVENVDTKRKELMKSSFEVTPMIRPMPNVTMFFVKDPAGVTIQFIE